MTSNTLSNMISAQSFPGLVLLGIAVLASLRLFYYGRTEEPEDALHLSLSVVGRVMIAIGLLESCLLFLSALVILLLIVALVLFGEEYWKYRAARQASLMVVLAAAARKSMPLSSAVEAFSNEWRGGFGRKARRLAQSLADGELLSRALRQIGGLASAKALAIIEAGEETGAMGPALAEATQLHLPRGALDKMAAIYWYLFVTTSAIISVNAFMMLKIMPAMKKIFQDFHLELPGATLALINISDALLTFTPLTFMLPFLALAIFVYVALRYLGVVLWEPPLISAFVRRWNMATVLRTAATAAEAERPLEIGLMALARSYPNPSLRRRLALALGDISLGADWCDSFLQHGLLREHEAGLLRAAARAGNLAWALRETAAGIERRCIYRLRATSQLLTPAVVLLLGGVTSVIVIGMFLPLVSLIENLL